MWLTCFTGSCHDLVKNDKLLFCSFTCNTGLVGLISKETTTRAVKDQCLPTLQVNKGAVSNTSITYECHSSSFRSSSEPLAVPDRPWWPVSVDFIIVLSATDRVHNGILTMK
jgi:hypothetical protein